MFKFLSFLAVSAILIFAPNTGTQKINGDGDKEYAAKATVAEWQILVSHPDDVPKNARDKAVTKIVSQIQFALAADTLPKPKTDTIPKKK